MKKRIGGLFAGAAAAVAVAVLVFVLYGSGGDRSSASQGDPPTIGQMQNFLIASARPPRPEASWSKADGQTISLTEFRGKVVLVNFWASWCAPCLRELPSIDKLRADMASDQFEVIAINIDQQGQKVAEPFIRSLNLNSLDLYLDPRGRMSRAVGVQVLPTTILYDRNGFEIGRLEGPAEWDQKDSKGLMQFYIDERLPG